MTDRDRFYLFRVIDRKEEPPPADFIIERLLRRQIRFLTE